MPGLETVPSSDPLISIERVLALFGNSGFQSREFFSDPFGTAKRMKSFLKMRVQWEEKLHVFRRIGDLIGGQRPGTPIGKRMRFGKFGTMDPLNKIGIRDLRAESQHGGRNLCIEERLGDLSGMQSKQVQILTAGMNDLFHVRIADQLPKWCERAIGLNGRKINHGGDVMRGHLNEFKFGDKAVLPNELRIQTQPPA